MASGVRARSRDAVSLNCARLCETYDGLAIFGPRSGAKTGEMAIPVPLPPDVPGLDATVTLVESLPPDTAVPLSGGGRFRHWFEHVEAGHVRETTTDGRPAVVGRGPVVYLAGWPDDENSGQAGVAIRHRTRHPDYSGPRRIAHSRQRIPPLCLQLRVRTGGMGGGSHPARRRSLAPSLTPRADKRHRIGNGRKGMVARWGGLPQPMDFRSLLELGHLPGSMLLNGLSRSMSEGRGRNAVKCDLLKAALARRGSRALLIPDA